MFCNYSVLVTLYKIGEVYFRFLGTNGFHVKEESERFTAAGSRCRQNLKYENSTLSFGTSRQKIAAKSVSHVQHDYFFSHSTNQIIDLWCCACCSRHFFNSVLRQWQQQKTPQMCIHLMSKVLIFCTPNTSSPASFILHIRVRFSFCTCAIILFRTCDFCCSISFQFRSHWRCIDSQQGRNFSDIAETNCSQNSQKSPPCSFWKAT